MGLVITIEAKWNKLVARVILTPALFPFAPDQRSEGVPLTNVLKVGLDELLAEQVSAPLVEVPTYVDELVTVGHHPVLRPLAPTRVVPFLDHGKVSRPWAEVAQAVYQKVCGTPFAVHKNAGRFHLPTQPCQYHSLARPQGQDHSTIVDYLTARIEA